MRILRQKRGEFSMQLLFSVLLSIAAITLFIVLVRTQAPKKLYCKTIYTSEKQDSFCEQYLAFSYLDKKRFTIEAFTTKRKLELFYMNHSPETRFLSFREGAEILHARLTLALFEKEIRRFSTLEPTVALGFPRFGGTRTVSTETLPRDSVVVDAQLMITGSRTPAEADIVFIIDTSSSMSDEWEAVCNIISEVRQNLTAEGVNLTLTVYGLDGGGTFDMCKNADIKESAMASILKLPIEMDVTWLDPPIYKHYDIGIVDSYAEAWATGSVWAIRNHTWREHAKHIIIPIGDSDPTGGAPSRWEYMGTYPDGSWKVRPLNKAEFTGTEQPAVDMLLAAATDDPWFYILPIYGDEDLVNPEGYDMGSNACITNPECQQILTWMNMLAKETGTLEVLEPVPSYRNEEQLLETILRVVLLPYPKAISLFVCNRKVWEYPGELNLQTSPQLIKGEDLAKAIEECAGGEVPITLESEEGTLLLHNLSITYLDNPLISMNINKTPVPMPGFSFEHKTVNISFRDQLKGELGACSKASCEVPVYFSAQRNGSFKVYDITVEYETYLLRDYLLQTILDCWDRSGRGRKTGNFLCQEVNIPPSYVFDVAVTEAQLTSLIKQRQLCKDFGNKELGCGNQDNLRVLGGIRDTNTILVEYHGDAKQIVVS